MKRRAKNLEPRNWFEVVSWGSLMLLLLGGIVVALAMQPELTSAILIAIAGSSLAGALSRQFQLFGAALLLFLVSMSAAGWLAVKALH